MTINAPLGFQHCFIFVLKATGNGKEVSPSEDLGFHHLSLVPDIVSNVPPGPPMESRRSDVVSSFSNSKEYKHSIEESC